MFRHYDTTHLAHSSNANQIERRENISVRWFAFSCFISPENQPTIGEFGVLNNRKFTCCWFSDNQPIYTPLGPQNPNQYEPNIRYSNFHLLQSPLLSSNYENILVVNEIARGYLIRSRRNFVLERSKSGEERHLRPLGSTNDENWDKMSQIHRSQCDAFCHNKLFICNVWFVEMKRHKSQPFIIWHCIDGKASAVDARTIGSPWLNSCSTKSLHIRMTIKTKSMKWNSWLDVDAMEGAAIYSEPKTRQNQS